jgi:hypothetical protein
MTGTWAVAVTAALAGVTAAPARSPRAAAGERFYRTGIGASGRPAAALLQTDIRSDSATLPCASCHLGSGFGSTEGGRVAPPLRWHRLSAAGSNSHGPRRGYDEQGAMRAVTDGVDSEGRPLSALMPRYQLDPRDRANLSAFLRSRGRPASPGVRDGHLTLAAVVTPDADPAQRRAMEAVLAEFRSHANPRRATTPHGPRRLSVDGTPEPVVPGYRDWTLSIWSLVGPPETWRRQLDARQAATPAFALVSGVGGATWEPVHRFCEERRIPCILPNVDAPPRADRAGWWSIYYSGGVGLEAEVMARSIHATARVAQVSRPGTAGAAGAARLRALRRVLDLDPASPLPEGVDAVVLWLPPAEARRHPAGGASGKAWLSATIAGSDAAFPGATVVRPWAFAADRGAGRDRFASWARARGLAPGDFRIQEQTFFACQLVGHALWHARDDLDREHVIELIEHTAGMDVFSASYPHLSFGTGQRFLSKGAYVTRPEEAPGRGAEWVVP